MALEIKDLKLSTGMNFSMKVIYREFKFWERNEIKYRFILVVVLDNVEWTNNCKYIFETSPC